eukprot:GHVQ01024021.1.p1 GENE.GHVQ01024021.1~~GHVQ01024021.1.p1  ORF type:complete len:313 (+),score=28.49 GHVQ01024021.1:72-1010(+)
MDRHSSQVVLRKPAAAGTLVLSQEVSSAGHAVVFNRQNLQIVRDTMFRTFTTRNVLQLCIAQCIVFAVVVPVVVSAFSSVDSEVIGVERTGMAPRRYAMSPLSRFDLTPVNRYGMSPRDVMLDLEERETKSIKDLARIEEDGTIELVVNCQFVNFFRERPRECEGAFERGFEFMQMCEERETAMSHFRRSALCDGFSFILRTIQQKCVDRNSGVYQSEPCEVLRELTMRDDSRCVMSPRFFRDHQVFCEDNRYYAVQFEADRCEDERYMARHVEGCSDVKSVLRRQWEMCGSQVYYWLHQQACEDMRLFMRS